MRIFNHILPDTAMPAPPKLNLPPPAEPKAAPKPKAEKPKAHFANFRIESPELWQEFKLAATIRKMTLIKAFSRAMKLFIDELTADLEVAAAQTEGEPKPHWSTMETA